MERTHRHRHTVFVYGSLMSGLPYHQQLRGARRIAHGLTLPDFHMFDLGHYPGVIRGGNTPIRGEVYHVTERLLSQLDAFEGVPTLYHRQHITLADGMPVQLYVLTSAPDSPDVRRVPSGDWRAWSSAR